jgi:ribosomal protein S6
MSKSEMPAAEANSYELAFHVLPTVAEGEVATVFQQLKDIITKAGGEITAEEAPARFDLAYEIIKYLEGRNRKFSSAYFGWIRFTVAPEQIEDISEAVEGTKELLRHLLIKLTKVEEENPFFFHEALVASQKSKTINLDEEDVEETDDEEAEASEDTTEEAEDAEETSDEAKK